jgi:hypothetical protein
VVVLVVVVFSAICVDQPLLGAALSQSIELRTKLITVFPSNTRL